MLASGSIEGSAPAALKELVALLLPAPQTLRSGSKEASEANECCERSGSKDFSGLLDLA